MSRLNPPEFLMLLPISILHVRLVRRSITALAGILVMSTPAGALSSEIEPACPYPETPLAEAVLATEIEAVNAPPVHPGLSYHDATPHDGFDDHTYSRERQRGDRLSGTSRFSAAAEVFGAPEEIPNARERNAEKRSESIERLMREHEETTGWTLLRDGLARDAILVFGDRAVAEPRSALPRAGYALARAELGNLHRGVDAMRAAIRTGVLSLHCAPVDNVLEARIESLADRYENEVSPSSSEVDKHFMRAALRYLQGNLEAAEVDIEHAILDGDESPSTASLHRMVQQRMLAPL